MHRDMTEGERVAVIRFQAEQLLADARALNVNVRITGVPLLPLAMRNYAPVIDVYPVRPDTSGDVALGSLKPGDKFRFARPSTKRVWRVTDESPAAMGVRENNSDVTFWYDCEYKVYKIEERKE